MRSAAPLIKSDKRLKGNSRFGRFVGLGLSEVSWSCNGMTKRQPFTRTGSVYHNENTHLPGLAVPNTDKVGGTTTPMAPTRTALAFD
jgi:hypothetical protein